jgi:hypothetical protein
MRIMWLWAFAIFAGLGLFLSSGLAQGQAQQQSQAPQEAQQPLKQVRLTDKDIQNFISAQKQLAPLSSKFEAAGDKPDPELQKQVEQIAKNSGFPTVEKLGEVSNNISLVLAGLDPQTGKFTEPPDVIRQEMEEIKQNKDISQEDKTQALADMQEALKVAAPLQYKENIALVKKYQKELDQVLEREPPQQQEPAKK